MAKRVKYYGDTTIIVPFAAEPKIGGTSARRGLLRLVITYSMSLSADGYIAGPDGSFDWGRPSEELHRFHNERVAAIDAQLLGRRLYETMLVWDTEEFSDPVMAEFAEIWRPLEKIVFSTTLKSVEGSNRLATGTLEEEISALGDRRIAVGGAGLAAECMRRGLIDEFELFIVAIVVGGGTPFFPPDVHIDLELIETRTFDATVYLHYRRRGWVGRRGKPAPRRS